ncbi:MAG: hypothetical protein GY705_25635 [Bacteroidetes bacterium]|nr:hypothetical protein [Bacteroidota bacterium]
MSRSEQNLSAFAQSWKFKHALKHLLLIGKQMVKYEYPVLRKGYKPKRIKTQQLFFLQGLPKVGPSTAEALLKKFGSLEKVVTASEQELKTVEGIGKKKAMNIRNFLTWTSQESA